MATKTKTVAVWKCRAKRCEYVYRDPIGHKAVGHKCPKRDGQWTTLRKVAR